VYYLYLCLWLHLWYISVIILDIWDIFVHLFIISSLSFRDENNPDHHKSHLRWKVLVITQLLHLGKIQINNIARVKVSFKPFSKNIEKKEKSLHIFFSWRNLCILTLEVLNTMMNAFFTSKTIFTFKCSLESVKKNLPERYWFFIWLFGWKLRECVNYFSAQLIIHWKKYWFCHRSVKNKRCHSQ